MTADANHERAALLEQAIRKKRETARTRSSALPLRPADVEPHLGEMQRGLWVLHQMDLDSPAYNLVSAHRVTGPLERSRLEESFREVVARHRILRSTFRIRAGEVFQMVNRGHEVALKRVAVGQGEMFAAATREARRPFDLSAGPLIRMLLLHEEDADSGDVLLLVMHHIVADEKSLQVLWQEIARAYAGEGREPAAESQFDDYVYWSTRTRRADREQELDYWRRRLDPLPEELTFPFEEPSADSRGRRGCLLRKAMDESVQESARRLATAAGATPFMVFAFTFRLLLQRYTQGQRVAFATPVSTRSHPATAEMIGYFLNPVVVSSAVDEELPVREALRAFADDMKDLLSHASVPFDALTEELAPARRPDRPPLCQVMFVYQRVTAAPDLGEARLEPLELDLGESKFDLTLFVSEAEQSTDVAVEYRADRFDPVWMERLLGHFETLLASLASDLDGRAADARMLSGGERREIAAWQGTTRPALRPCVEGAGVAEAAVGPSEVPLLPQQIAAWARRTPDATAVSFAGEQWSHRRLADEAAHIAHELRSARLTAGDRIGIYLQRSPWMIAALMGAHRAGGAYVPLDPGYPAQRNRDVLVDADVSAVLTTASLRGELPEGDWSVVPVDELEPGSAEDEEPVAVPGTSTAYIPYTSGSTGRPKGAVVSHENLRASTWARSQFYGSPPGRFLLLPSVAFDSSVAGIFWALSSGGTLVIPTDEEIRDIPRLALLTEDEQVTSLLCVPSLYEAMLTAEGERLRGLEIAIVAGESCPSRLVREHFRVLPDTRLFNEYGPTEATVWATVHEASPADAERPVAIGRPIPGVRIQVLDSRGREVPAGIPGQATISGPTVAQGYWRREELTGEHFVVSSGEDGNAGGAYRTGDVVKWTTDGRLIFLGREDEQIKLRGFRIEPGEVEAALLERAEIEEVAVVARPITSEPSPAPEAPRQLVAFIRPRAGTAAASWGDELERRLPDFMLPRQYVTLADLPRLPNGKVDRNRLRTMPLGKEAAVAAEPPASDRESSLMALWEGLLARSGFGVTDNFFELGGHSLLVVEMTQAIERDHGVDLVAADVFQHPTVRGVAKLVECQSTPAAPAYAHLFPIQPGGRRAPLVVCIPHFFSEVLARRFRGERPVYGLRGVSLRAEGNRGRWATMTELAEELVDEILRRFPDGGCIMAGYSFGASMAFEAVRVMEDRGVAVRGLYLIAPMPLDFYRLGPFGVQIRGLRKPIEELSPAEALLLIVKDNNPLTLRPYRRAWRRLGVHSWRRVLCALGSLRRRFGLPLTPRILHADVRVERFRLHGGFTPGRVRTPGVVFNAREPGTDAAATWRPHFEGLMTVCETPDPHLGEAHVEQAKSVILRVLNELEDA